jgi:hypothetical protein
MRTFSFFYYDASSQIDSNQQTFQVDVHHTAYSLTHYGQVATASIEFYQMKNTLLDELNHVDAAERLKYAIRHLDRINKADFEAIVERLPQKQKGYLLAEMLKKIDDEQEKWQFVKSHIALVSSDPHDSDQRAEITLQLANEYLEPFMYAWWNFNTRHHTYPRHHRLEHSEPQHDIVSVEIEKHPFFSQSRSARRIAWLGRSTELLSQLRRGSVP